MPKESPSYFHRVNDELTVSLAEVATVFDHTEYITGLADKPEHRKWATGRLQSGQTCHVGMRPSGGGIAASVATRNDAGRFAAGVLRGKVSK